MVDYTNEIRLENGYIYSLDMLRLNLYFNNDMIQDFLNWMSEYNLKSDNLEITYWMSIKEFAYRHMFRINTKEYSFALAVWFNGNAQDRNKGYIEFNPNKCKGEHFQNIWEHVIDATNSTEVVRFDLAIDIPLPKYLVKICKDQRNYTYMSKQSSDTEYLGQRNTTGFTKLYNKTAESKLSYDLTRLEITADLDGINFPEVKILPMQEKLDFSELTSTERVLIQLLKQVDNPNMYLKQLKYEKRKTLEDFLFEETLQLDKKAYDMIYKQVIGYQYR